MRQLAYAQHSKSRQAGKNSWPRLAVERQEELTKDPEALVREVHEKDRVVFRDALEERDFACAYQIYEEQRGLPILSGAEVTSLIQLIAADAVLRKWNGFEQPESLYDVFCTIVDDVKRRKVSGQAMLWAHALDVLVTWERLGEAEELWQFLQALPNRTSVDKNDALCIDSRVYGAAVKLYTALNDMSKVEELYKEALETRKLTPSLMLDQAMIQALFQNKRIGEAYKHMDRTIREQRRALRPGFFNNMISLALEAEAIGVATEIFMKACKISMPPSSTIVTRLLAALGRSHTDPLKAVMTIFKHYRAVAGGAIPVEHVNCVIEAMFNSYNHDVPREEVLNRVHQLLKEMQESRMRSSTSTINILLKGYISMDSQALADDLVARAQLNENSFRAMLKAYAQTQQSSLFVNVQECWNTFIYYLQSKRIDVSPRDIQMLMRASFATDKSEARLWLPQVMPDIVASFDPQDQDIIDNELQRHLDGTFVHTRQKYDQSRNRDAHARLLKVSSDINKSSSQCIASV